MLYKTKSLLSIIIKHNNKYANEWLLIIIFCRIIFVLDISNIIYYKVGPKCRTHLRPTCHRAEVSRAEVSKADVS